MTERKFTDEQIIKALGCLAGDDGPCHGCIYQKTPFPTCRELVGRQALDLINRQRAELKALKMDNDQLQSDIVNATMNLESVQHELDKAQAEIERLTVEYAGFRGAANSLKMHYENARAEAIKEFAERVKEIKVKYELPLLGLQTKTEIENYVDDILLQMRDGIDRLVKEMTEGGEQK